MISNIVDYIFLDRETRNLHKINHIWQRYNDVIYGDYVLSLIEEMKKINTVEHSEKVDHFMNIISMGKSIYPSIHGEDI